MLCTAGCAIQPPAVTRLGDGVYRAPTAREAEAYCRNSGDPTRLVKQPDALTDSAGVLFRCD